MRRSTNYLARHSAFGSAPLSTNASHLFASSSNGTTHRFIAQRNLASSSAFPLLCIFPTHRQPVFQYQSSPIAGRRSYATQKDKINQKRIERTRERVKETAKEAQKKVFKKHQQRHDEKSKKMLLEPESHDFNRRTAKPVLPKKGRLTHDGRDYQMLRIQTAKLAAKELRDVESTTGPLPPVIVFKLLKALESEGKNCPALRLVPRVSGGKRLSHYAPLILQLVEMKCIDLAFSIYDTMQKEQIVPNDKVFKAIVTGCVQHERKDRLLNVLDEVIAFNKTRPAATEVQEPSGGEDDEDGYNSNHAADLPGIFYSIVNGFGKQGKLELMIEFFGKMKSYGVTPELDFYDTVIRHLLAGDKIDSSLGLLNQMQQQGPTPSIKTYTLIIDWYSSKGEMEKAVGLLNAMRNEAKLEPNVVTLTSIIHGYARKGELAHTLLWLHKMQEDFKVEPNIATYNAVLVAHEKRGDANAVWEAFTDMILNNTTIKPNRATFALLLNLCLRTKQRERGMHYIGLMESQGISSVTMKDLVGKIEDLASEPNPYRSQSW